MAEFVAALGHSIWNAEDKAWLFTLTTRPDTLTQQRSVVKFPFEEVDQLYGYGKVSNAAYLNRISVDGKEYNSMDAYLQYHDVLNSAGIMKAAQERKPRFGQVI